MTTKVKPQAPKTSNELSKEMPDFAKANNPTKPQVKPEANSDKKADVSEIEKPADRTHVTKEIERGIKQTQLAIEKTQERIDRETQKCNEWIKEGNRLLEVAKDKFELDKVKKILSLKEANDSDTIDVLISYYKKEIDRLTEKKEKIDKSGSKGKVSPEYKQFLLKRTERFERRQSNIIRSWIVYSEDYLKRKLPPLEDKLKMLQTDLEQKEKQLQDSKA